MPTKLMVVWTNPVSKEAEEEYNTWYNKVHLPDVLRVPGFVAATRYRYTGVPALEGMDDPPHRYLALYEVNAENVKEAAEVLAAGVGAGEIALSEALDMSSFAAHFFEPVSDRLVEEK
ncbi:DUF4286 family protein [Sporichthya polymorpha]|uniref:DUF4286 family protein n=1 Tax=Sporichthya polymorpha TaxID=35751 RepID=UPI00037A9260|nr:DUF4286 family protein [Sporichthya polymorpha]